MQFNSFIEIVEMSGYGSFVWSSVIIVLLVLVMLTYDSVKLKKKSLSRIHQELKRAEKIQQAKQTNQSVSE